MEIRDLYDENKRLTGQTIRKGEKVPSGAYIIIVKVFIENKDGKLLLQKRNKNIYGGGKWAITSGHPKSGESSLEGAITEVYEELGIDISSENLELIDTMVEENVISDVYRVVMNIDLKDIKLQKEEVSEVKFASYDETLELIEKGMFFKFHKQPFKIIYKKFHEFEK